MHKQSRQQYRMGLCRGCECMRPIAVGLKTCDKCCEKSLKYNRKNQAKGLCRDCPRPAVAGRIRCEVHLSAHRKWSTLTRKNSRKHGLCRECNTPIAPGERGCRCDYYKYLHMMQERGRRAIRRQKLGTLRHDDSLTAQITEK